MGFQTTPKLTLQLHTCVSFGVENMEESLIPHLNDATLLLDISDRQLLVAKLFVHLFRSQM